MEILEETLESIVIKFSISGSNYHAIKTVHTYDLDFLCVMETYERIVVTGSAWIGYNTVKVSLAKNIPYDQFDISALRGDLYVVRWIGNKLIPYLYLKV